MPADKSPKYLQVFGYAFVILFIISAVKGFSDKTNERHIEGLVTRNIKFENNYVIFTCKDIDNIIKYDIEKNEVLTSFVGEYNASYRLSPSLRSIFPSTYDLAVLVTAAGSGYTIKSVVETINDRKKIRSRPRKIRNTISLLAGIFTGYAAGVNFASLFPLYCDYDTIIKYFGERENQLKIEHFIYFIAQVSLFQCSLDLKSDIDLLLRVEAQEGSGGHLPRYNVMEYFEINRRVARMMINGEVDKLTHGISKQNNQRLQDLQNQYIKVGYDFSTGELTHAERQIDFCLASRSRVLSITEKKMIRKGWLVKKEALVSVSGTRNFRNDQLNRQKSNLFSTVPILLDFPPNL